MKDLPKSVTDIDNKQVRAKAIEDLKEFFAFTSQAQFAKFGELLKAGFSKEEAIELCKGPLFINVLPPSNNGE